MVGSKWVFKVKKDAADQIERYCARLVAQGFTQVPGVDYFDMFTPIAKCTSIRTVLTTAAINDWEIQQLNIKSTYLNGELDPAEIIFMRQPPGYAIPRQEQCVLCLIKAIYGLKQSGRHWYEKLHDILTSQGLTRCELDHTVFFHHEKNDIIIITVYVNDMLLALSSLKLLTKTKDKLRTFVEVSDLGNIHWLLGFEIKRDCEARLVSISQKSYVESIIKHYRMEDAKPLSIPMDPNVSLSKSQSPMEPQKIAEMCEIPYHEIVGSLTYTAIGSHPDIAFTTSMLSHFNKNPGRVHWEAAKRVVHYLKGTPDWGITFGPGHEDDGMVGYTDTDGNSNEDRHAISGYVFMLNGGPISWSVKTQEIIALLTTEAEYVAMTHAAKEVLWLRSFVGEVFGPVVDATTLFCDNQSAIVLAKDGKFYARTKCIDIYYHFIHYIIEDGTINLIYCPTDEMVADTLTKALPNAKAKHFAVAIGLRPA